MNPSYSRDPAVDAVIEKGFHVLPYIRKSTGSYITIEPLKLSFGQLLTDHTIVIEKKLTPESVIDYYRSKLKNFNNHYLNLLVSPIAQVFETSKLQ